MALYHFTAKLVRRHQARVNPDDPSGPRVSRGPVQSVVAAAAYRAAEALLDAQTGRTHDYLTKAGVIHSQILLPAGAPARWADRATLWNEVEQVERRSDAQLAKEIELGLPRELTQADAIRLVTDFAHAQFVSRGMVADVNIHWGQSADGLAQPHAHILLSMRRVVPGPAGRPEEGGFGLKDRGWNDRSLLPAWRAAWADLVNARLAEAGFDVRVDHRSNAARGIALEPQNKIGPAGARRAVRGEDAERAAEHRAIARRNGERLLADPMLALRALTQQQSTFTRQDLARLVHRHSDGAAQFAAVMAKVEASPELVRVGQDGRDRARFSTREMVATERRLEAAALTLSQRHTHLVAVARRRAMAFGSALGSEQRLAFAHVTWSRDLSVVVGYAGTGKSTMLGVAREAWEVEGYTVRGAALSGIAAEGLEAGSGIASRTIASLEHAWTQGRDTLTNRDVLVVDESGMIGSRQMERVLSAAQRAGAKVVLVGDPEQLQAIEAGGAFRAIVERFGAIELTEVRRQETPWQREATRELAKGKTEEALARYTEAGMVHVHATDEAAAMDVIAGWQAGRQSAPAASRIMLAHTRDGVRRMNEWARGIRREAGELGEDRVLQTELGARPFAAGDRIYFLRNERGLGVRNGSLGTIAAIDGEGQDARLTVQLDRKDGVTGAAAVVAFGLAEYAHIDHGYAATVHKAQSVTVDHAHVLATPGMDRHLAYVAMTRHRHSLALHWSREAFASPEELASRLGRDRAKDTTLDYGESEAELCTAYAARRGLHPVAAPREMAAAQVAASTSARSALDRKTFLAAFGARVAAQPGLVRRNLERRQFEELRPALIELRQVVETWRAATAGVATWVKGKAEEQARAVAAAVAKPATPAPGPDPKEMARLTALVASHPPSGPRSMPERFAWFEARTALERLQKLQRKATEALRRAEAAGMGDGRAARDGMIGDVPAPAPATPIPAAPSSGRRKPAAPRRAARERAPVPTRPVPEPLPWAGLDPAPPASPLVPAERYKPMRTGQIGAAVERGLDREHRHLERRYKEVYRSSGDAEGRFTLLKAELGVEAARARVARDPGILGSLRGGWLTANGRKERAQALQSGRGIVNEEQNLSRAREEALRYRRAEEEQWRERAMIEVPALSAKAQAAIDAFGEARPGWTPPELSRDRNPTPERIVGIAKCARLYEAVLADGPLLAELNRFEKAAASRLGHDDQFGSPGSRQLSDAERQAERYYGVLVAARALHAWYPVLRDHVAADPTLKLRVEQAEFLLRRADEQRPGHRSPSSGPSFGPGM